MRRRFVSPNEIPAAVILPVGAKAYSMFAPLPGDRIIELEAAAEIVGRRRISDEQAGLRNIDRGRAKPQTARAVLFSGRSHRWC